MLFKNGRLCFWFLCVEGPSFWIMSLLYWNKQFAEHLGTPVKTHAFGSGQDPRIMALAEDRCLPLNQLCYTGTLLGLTFHLEM